MVSFFKAISKIKKRGTPLQKKRKESRKHGSIECICKKAKGNRKDMTIGGKLITSKSQGSPVNHIRIKRAKGMSEGVWALTGGVDNPCRCSIVAGQFDYRKKGKRRVLKGVNMVQIKYR